MSNCHPGIASLQVFIDDLSSADRLMQRKCVTRMRILLHLMQLHLRAVVGGVIELVLHFIPRFYQTKTSLCIISVSVESFLHNNKEEVVFFVSGGRRFWYYVADRTMTAPPT